MKIYVGIKNGLLVGLLHKNDQDEIIFMEPTTDKFIDITRMQLINPKVDPNNEKVEFKDRLTLIFCNIQNVDPLTEGPILPVTIVNKRFKADNNIRVFIPFNELHKVKGEKVGSHYVINTPTYHIVMSVSHNKAHVNGTVDLDPKSIILTDALVELKIKSSNEEN